MHLILSDNAKTTLKYESNQDDFIIQNDKNLIMYNDKQSWADIASGSFGVDAMIIIPCSMNTLAKCAIGISDTLITRVFNVMLKEKRKIILALGFIILGLCLKEHVLIYNYAKRICFSCIGLG